MKTLIALLTVVSTYAVHADEITFSGEIVKKAPLEIKFAPPAAHHFNLQGPASVDVANGAATEKGTLVKDEHKIEVSFPKLAKLDKDCTVKANLYVCNDANTYCKPVKQNFDCATLKSK